VDTKRFKSNTGSGIAVNATDEFGAEHRVRVEPDTPFETKDPGLIGVLEGTRMLDEIKADSKKEEPKSEPKAEAKPEPKPEAKVEVKEPEPKKAEPKKAEPDKTDSGKGGKDAQK